MSHKVFSQIKQMAVAGMAILVISGSVLANERAEVIERIKPIGQVTVAAQAQSAVPTTAVTVAAPATAPAAPADPGAALYTAKGCTACHGAEGKAPIMTTYPKVAALPEPYIINQMKDIKSGARNNGQTAAMKGIMAAVSDEDMQVIAAWLSALPRTAAAAPVATAAPTPTAAPAAPAADPGAALYTSKGCIACHGAEGKAPIMTTYPKVAALPEPYIINQMKDIKSGARSNGQAAVMKGIMATVSEDDMKAIAGWLSKRPR